MSNASKTVRTAVIGLGMGKGHVNAYTHDPMAELVAVCDIDEARLAWALREHDLSEEACYTDYKKMLADAEKLRLDAVSIALPNAMHAPVSIDCLKAGLHVLCEKPMAMNADQAKGMITAAESAGRKLMINFSTRFQTQSQALKRFVDQGHLGQMYYGRTVWHRRRGMPGFGGWFGTKELSGGGPIIDLGVHRLDLAMWLMGNPRPVTVSASTYNVIGERLARESGKTFDVEDLGAALIRFDGGQTLLLEASWAGFTEKDQSMATELWGTEGGLIQRNTGEWYDFEARVYTEEAGSLWERRFQQPVTDSPSSYSEFIAAILDDREPSAPGAHGLAVQQILDAVYESAETGREVRIQQD